MDKSGNPKSLQIKINQTVIQYKLNKPVATVLIGGWILAMLTAAAGLAQLVNPGGETKIDSSASNPEVVRVSEEVAPENKSEAVRLPGWLVAMLLLSCTAGSFWVTFMLKYATIASQSKRTKRQKIKRKPSSKKLSLPLQHQKNSKLVKRNAVNAGKQMAIGVPSVSKKSSVNNTKPTLADIMDLRQNHSLNSLVHKPKNS